MRFFCYVLQAVDSWDNLVIIEFKVDQEFSINIFEKYYKNYTFETKEHWNLSQQRTVVW